MLLAIFHWSLFCRLPSFQRCQANLRLLTIVWITIVILQHGFSAEFTSANILNGLDPAVPLSSHFVRSCCFSLWCGEDDPPVAEQAYCGEGFIAVGFFQCMFYRWCMTRCTKQGVKRGGEIPVAAQPSRHFVHGEEEESQHQHQSSSSLGGEKKGERIVREKKDGK
jgi:hypothetical protein